MPFRHSLRDKKTKQFRTAQLHIQNQNKTAKGAERTPRRKGMLCSLSVEAAVALPVFLSAMCLLMYPIRIIQAESDAQRKLEQAAEYICVAEGLRMTVKTSVEENSENTAVGQDGAEKAADEETDGEDAELTPSGIMTLAEDVYSFGTVLTAFDMSVFEYVIPTELKMPTAEEPVVKVKAVCIVNFPFTDLLGDRIQDIRLVSCRRAWVGRKGGAGRNWQETEKTETGNSEEEEDQIVYVARNSSKSGRYHLSMECFYLSNEMSAVPRSSVAGLRNKEGGKYRPCASCQPGRCETVYIFEHGDAYHSTPQCKANRSYAVEMKKSEAVGKGLSPCTNCSRRYGH